MKNGKRMIQTAVVGLAALLTAPASGTRAEASAAISSRPDVSVGAAQKLTIARSYGQMPLHFEANRGQTDPQVRFLSRGSGYSLFLTPTEAVMVLQKPSAALDPTVVRLRLVGSNPAPSVHGVDELPGKANYFFGNDPSHWRTGVPLFARVEYRAVYPGIDLVYYGNQRQLEYDFVLAPGADPGTIRLGLTGARKLRLDRQGNLVLQTAGGDLVQRAPVIYQERDGIRTTIAGRYVRRAQSEVGFEVEAYDRTRPLVIDPVLTYSTYLGGGTEDEAHGIALDADGNAYITGQTGSATTFPHVNGLFPPLGGYGGWEAFVTKLNPAGSALVYSTVLGGSGSDLGHAIAVDSLGQAYVTGQTRSVNFPTTPGAYQQAINVVHYSAFVSKLNADGNGLLYSTFLGGNTVVTAGDVALQEGQDIAVDAMGHAYVTGWTTATDFPVKDACQATHGGVGTEDAFVTKLDTTATGAAALVYSTYLGGGAIDLGRGIAVDSVGRAYVTGTTNSGAGAPFPTANAFQPALAGQTDAFVSKLDTTASGAASLIYSTYLGGSNNENPNTPWPGGIAIDATGAAYVTGSTNSWSSASKPFPTTPTGYKTTLSLGLDAFLTKLDPGGAALAYSTFLGGDGREDGFGVAVDATGQAYVTGLTGSSNFPVKNAVQAVFGGGTNDAFVALFDPGASGAASLVYSTFLGGSAADRGFAIAVDSKGDAHVAGATSSSNFQTTPGAFDGAISGPSDAFVAKLQGPGLRFVKGDLDNDGKTDLVLRHQPTGTNLAWLMNGTTRASQALITPSPVGLDWRVAGIDDFNGDRRNDLVLSNQVTGASEFWLMNGTARVGAAVPLASPAAPPWKLAATADFNHDGKPDLLWRNSTTQKIQVWTMNGTATQGTLIPTPDQAADSNWAIVAALDWSGDQNTDLLWYNATSGKVVLWLMDAAVQRISGQFTNPPNAGDNNWNVVAAGDYGVGPGGLPGTKDIVWRNASSGNFVVWYMDQAANRTSGTFTNPTAPSPNSTDWTIVGPR